MNYLAGVAELADALAGLDKQLVQAYTSDIASNPNGNLAAMPGYLVTNSIIPGAENRINSLFASVQV